MNNLSNNTKGLISALALIATVVVGGGSIVLGTGALSNINKQGCGSVYKAWSNGDIYARLADADDDEALAHAERCRKTIIKVVKAAGPVASLMSASGNLGGGSNWKEALTKADTVIIDRILDWLDKSSDPEVKDPKINAIFPPAVINKWNQYFKENKYSDPQFKIKPMVVGSIKSKTTGEPIKDAHVKLTLWNIDDVYSEDKTDDSGEYIQKEIMEGAYKLIIEAEKYEPRIYKIFVESIIVTVQDDETSNILSKRAFGPDEYVTINAELEDKMIELNGEVIDAEEGNGIGGAKLEYVKLFGAEVVQTLNTNAKGEYEMKVFDARGYQLSISAGGYQTVRLDPSATVFDGIVKLKPEEVKEEPEPEPAAVENKDEGRHVEGSHRGGDIDGGPANEYEAENQMAALMCCGQRGGVVGFVVKDGMMIKNCDGVDLFEYYEKNCR